MPASEHGSLVQIFTSVNFPNDGHCEMIHLSLNAYHCLYKSYVAKQLVAWEEQCAKNFSFSHCVLCHFRELSTIIIKLKAVVCILFKFGRV